MSVLRWIMSYRCSAVLGWSFMICAAVAEHFDAPLAAQVKLVCLAIFWIAVATYERIGEM